MRIEQKPGGRGSLKWIQRAVAERWPELEDPIKARTRASGINWVSPLPDDEYAEYRDGSFLALVGQSRLAGPLAGFWPSRGPQWDALGMFGERGVLLLEAKSHVTEFCTPPSGAGPASRDRIDARLREIAHDLGSERGHCWIDCFYQLSNRLAHLWFLRENDVDALLVLVGFLGDEPMKGPESAEVWDVSYKIASYVLGLPGRHKLSPYILHVHPRVPNE